VATKTLDICVNTGHEQGHKILQRACNDLGQALDDDGRFGPLTITAVNQCNPAMLLEAIKARQVNFYRQLCTKDAKYVLFLAGWLKRASWPEET